MKLDFIPRTCPLCGSENAKVLVEATLDEGRLTASAFASRKLPEYMHSRMVEEPGYRQEFGLGISASSGPAKGAVVVSVVTDRAAFDRFLQISASAWKYV